MNVTIRCPICKNGEKVYECDLLEPEPDVGLMGWGAECSIDEAQSCDCVLDKATDKKLLEEVEARAIEYPEDDY